MRLGYKGALAACLICLAPVQSFAQDTDGGAAQAPTPAPEASELPAVEVIQEKAQPAPKAAQKKSAPKKKQAAAPAPQPAAEPTAPELTEGTGGIDTGTVQMSPVPGSAIPIGKYPGAVGRASASDIQRTGDSYLPEVIQNTVPSALISDAQGNVFQRSLQYRGFDASPVNGQAQGLAVYQNGVRINEAFGDVVNWDFLPDSAIDGISIIGANPVYGLNALGGAASIVMRDGFNFQGAELDARFGSFGRAQGSLALGGSSGAFGVFLAIEGIRDDGFRDFSEAEIKRMYADFGVKGDGSEFHLNFTGANNSVGVTAAAPETLLDLGWERTFTSPQTTDNEMHMLSLNGSVEATPTMTISGVGYYRWFKQKHADGNIAEAEACDDGPDGIADSGDEELCLEEDGSLEEAESIEGDDMDWDPNLHYGTIDRTEQDARSYGASLQAVEKTPLFGMPNHFLIGASYDHGEVDYSTSSELGYFLPKFVVSGFTDPFILAEPDDFYPRNLSTQNDYIGLYLINTLDVTSDLSVSVGGRYNYARIKIEDNTGENPELNGDHTYERFNPMAGATYKLMQGLTLYGSYAEANRAPTAAELACADPEEPCLIESFLTADPPLDQVVSRTFELGLRGKLMSFGGGQMLEWTAGLFRTENQDDIIAIAAPTSGRGYFQNAGDTLRQGVELGLQYQTQQLLFYANYAYIDATFQSALELASPDNPVAVDCPSAPGENCVLVQDGDRLPGVPQHRFKAGFDYWVTRAWKVGADVVAVSDQVFFGDEGNDNTTLDGYARVDIRTSYNITPNVQIYGMVDNVFDSRYGLFGNYFNVDAANEAAEADGLGSSYFSDTNNRTITPAPPVAAYGGIKVRY